MRERERERERESERERKRERDDIVDHNSQCSKLAQKQVQQQTWLGREGDPPESMQMAKIWSYWQILKNFEMRTPNPGQMTRSSFDIQEKINLSTSGLC